eukprot:XP_791972.4 PREDICTED: paladin [Strongylocentrotus purpuratus]
MVDASTLNMNFIYCFQIVHFALINADNEYAFYDDIEDLSDEPHLNQLTFIEDIQTTSEVYSLHSFGIHNASFTRVPMSSSKTPINEVIDQLLNAVKEVPSLFSNEESSLPILVFTGHMGGGRTTFAMSLGILIMAHQRGFPAHVYDSHPSNDGSPKLELGEFWAIMKVCSLLPDGMKRKREVDSILDLCADMGNIREKIVECHNKLQEIQEDYQIAGQSAREYYLENALRYLKRYCYLIIFNSYLHEQVADDFVGLDVLRSQREVGTSNFRKVPGLPVYGMAQPSSKGQSAREYYLENALRYLKRYCYLIIFNSYLHEQFQQCFCRSFTSWMRQHPELYTALAHINSSERTAPPELITKGLRFLVADDFVGLDVLRSQREVGTSNFRKVPGLPVYGMAQPSSKGLERVCQYLLSKKHGHSSIHSFNLRGEMIIQCDSTTYTPRELASLDKNISVSGLSERDVEKKEIQLKNEILRSKHSIQVYTDVAEPKKTIEFDTVTTLHEMYEDQIKQTPQLHYYHIVGGFQCSGPLEKTINRIVTVVKDLDDIFTDEDGPALLFNCHTGKEQTTVAMAIAGLIIWHKKGFPVGTKLGEQERISVPQAEYTKGEFSAVRKLVMRLPHGTQVKREVDLMLDKCSETMTPMHFHLREVIFSMFNKIKTAKGEEVNCLYQQSLDNLERYIYLIMFNAYLHMQRVTNWEMPFQHWMKTVAYDILDHLTFGELDIESRFSISSMRDRWCREATPKTIIRGFLI